MFGLSLSDANEALREKHPSEIVAWALALNRHTVVTTNFGPHEAAILHMVATQGSDTSVVWIDSGYNTAATYRFADQVIEQLGIAEQLKIYHPQISAAHRNAQMRGIPDIDNPLHDVFTQQVKLEPFQRAMDEIKPDVWLTAIRQEQTPFRQNLDVLTADESRGLLKVAPVFYWSEAEIETYLCEHGLPIEKDYFDPTKVLGNRECGLHTA